MTVSCGWSLSWANNPEVKACYKFLNPLLVLPDRRTLGNQVLTEIVNDTNKNMEIALRKDQIGPYIWKAIDISSEREKFQDVIDKTESMLKFEKKFGRFSSGRWATYKKAYMETPQLTDNLAGPTLLENFGLDNEDYNELFDENGANNTENSVDDTENGANDTENGADNTENGIESTKRNINGIDYCFK
ncbi:hypothetical protein C2G38_2249936 [Gigaspora rosea]|uniref:Uncharacterized protein n=1 Tax=Gigaspora rosea TaxID=44941 RepID=A0A397UQC2_9GLOM|nr:hypothetical protein C2G38_2249936 [Gigaspora rosea]